MKRRAGIMLAGSLLALGLWSLTAYSADDDDDKKLNKEAQEAVIKLMESVKGKKGDVKAQAEAMKKKFEELKPIMWVYKPRKKGGIGFGKDGDDIEQTIGKVGSRTAKGMTPAKIKAMKDDLIKSAEITKAISEVTDLYAGQYAKKDAAKWKGYTKEMRKGADDLIEAANGGNVDQIKKAANNLSASCTNCHSDFRE
ncbi:MAG TPA: cytochrome c [Gemmataceae bacterium]|jgi:cytochrome c556